MDTVTVQLKTIPVGSLSRGAITVEENAENEDRQIVG